MEEYSEVPRQNKLLKELPEGVSGGIESPEEYSRIFSGIPRSTIRRNPQMEFLHESFSSFFWKSSKSSSNFRKIPRLNPVRIPRGVSKRFSEEIYSRNPQRNLEESTEFIRQKKFVIVGCDF